MTIFTPSYSPQSPSAFMNHSHAPNSTMTEKYNQHTPPSSYPRQPTSTSSSLLTPASTTGAPNSTHEDMDLDDSYNEGNPHKRRRTYGSFDAERRSVPPNLRHAGNSTDEKMASPPSMAQIQELIQNPDCSPYHLVCEKPHPKLYPDPTENLISLYGLQSIADKVARFDPATGKKNKLRKSYKGYISTLAGKNEVVAKPTNLGQVYDPSSLDPSEQKLQWLAGYPDEEWKLSHVLGKELSRGIDMQKLRRGLTGITKGDIPGFDASVLGLDDEQQGPKKRPETARATPSIAAATPQQLNTPADDRPQRKGKRRRYDEGSYEGYEGYDDDDTGGGAPGGSVWPGAQTNLKKKKRKKNTDVDSPAIGGMDLGRHSVPQSSMIYGR